VGIAIGSGTDVAVESSEMFLMTDDFMNAYKICPFSKTLKLRLPLI